MSVAAVDPRVALGPSLAPGAGTAVVEMLDRLRPVVRVDPRAGEAAALAAAALFSLLVRTHAHTLLDGDAPLGPNPWAVNRLSELPERLGLCRPPAAASPDRELVIAVGPGGGTADLWVGGDDLDFRSFDPAQPYSVDRVIQDRPLRLATSLGFAPGFGPDGSSAGSMSWRESLCSSLMSSRSLRALSNSGW